MHLGHRGSSSSCPFEPRHESSPNKRGFQSYNKRCFSFKGSYLGFIALKEIQIRFATVPILNRERERERWREGASRKREGAIRQRATRWQHKPANRVPAASSCKTWTDPNPAAEPPQPVYVPLFMSTHRKLDNSSFFLIA